MVDKLLGLWISGKVGFYFVTGVHDTGVVAATKKMANFFERKLELGKEEVGSEVAGSNKVFLANFAT